MYSSFMLAVQLMEVEADGRLKWRDEKLLSGKVDVKNIIIRLLLTFVPLS